MMIKVTTTTKFEKSKKRMKKRGKDFSKLKKVISYFATEELLPMKYKDHILKGNYQGYRECHIEPDWLLVYKFTEDEIILYDTGTHSDLF